MNQNQQGSEWLALIPLILAGLTLIWGVVTSREWTAVIIMLGIGVVSLIAMTGCWRYLAAKRLPWHRRLWLFFIGEKDENQPVLMSTREDK